MRTKGKKEKKRKEKGVCAFQNTFTQLWIFGYKVHVFTTATVPVPRFRKTNGELKCE